MSGLRDFNQADVAAYLEARLLAIQRRIETRWGALFLDTSSPDFASTAHQLSQDVCNREITRLFSQAFVNSFYCSSEGCPERATQRCHGPTYTRPRLWKECLQQCVDPKTNSVRVYDVLFLFLRRHSEDNGFTFKCANCHRQEDRML